MKYEVWLKELRGLKNESKILLRERVDSARDVYYISQKDFYSAGLTGRDWMKFSLERNLERLSKAEKILEYIKAKKIKLILFFSKSYPVYLRNIFDPPYGLYVLGSDIKNIPMAGIVGARRGTSYGFNMAEKYASFLSSRGIGIVSGMALGCDAHAHLGAIKGEGYTLAVLGSGVDVCYPRQNYFLYRKIIESGGSIVSEYMPGTTPKKYTFPERNRIVAGLSKCLLVMEAGRRSGTLITADRALEEGRDVFALPGRVDMPMSEGCNDLIRQGAFILSTPEELYQENFNTEYIL